jgi:hypothetical protein
MSEATIKSAVIATMLQAHRSYGEIRDSLHVSFNTIAKGKCVLESNSPSHLPDRSDNRQRCACYSFNCATKENKEWDEEEDKECAEEDEDAERDDREIREENDERGEAQMFCKNQREDDEEHGLGSADSST